MHRVLRNRAFRLLLAAQTVSRAGDFLYGIALSVYIYDLTGSAGWVAAANVIRLAPYILFGPLGGAIADRWDRRRVMVLADGVRAGLMLLLAAFAAADAVVMVVVAVAFASTAASAVYLPAVTALTPELVPEEDLAAANTLTSALDNVALIVGPAVGGVLLLAGSPEAAFVLNAATFAVSAACLTRMRRPELQAEARAEVERAGRLLDDLRDGLTAARSIPALAPIAVFSLVGSVLYGMELVLYVLVAEDRLGIGAEGVSFLLAAAGVGGLVGLLWCERAANGRRPAMAFAAVTVGFGIPFVGLAVVSDPVVAYGLLAVEGVAVIVYDVLLVTMLQRTVRREVLARVSGLIDATEVGGILIGSVAAPVLVDRLGLETTLVLAGVLLPGAVLAWWPRLRVLDDVAARRHDQLEPRVAVLRSLEIFDGAPPTSLEAVAAAVVEERIRAGADVVREGQPAQDFFIVRSGRFDALAADHTGTPVHHLSSMDEGAYFGEIGVLEHRPRTATVRAVTDGVLWRINGQEFLHAVTVPAALPGGLADTVSARLARTRSIAGRAAGPVTGSARSAGCGIDKGASDGR